MDIRLVGDYWMNDESKRLLLAFDDEGFCDMFIPCVEGQRHRGLYPRETPYLYEGCFAERLAEIRQKNTALFYGTFFPEVRRIVGSAEASDWRYYLSHRLWQVEALPRPSVEERTALTLAEWGRGACPGIAPGWKDLQEYYTVRPGELTVVTGIASHMKSTFIQALAINLALAHQWHFAVCSPEHLPVTELDRQLAVQYLASTGTPQTLESRRSALEWVAEHFFPIGMGEDDAPTVSHLLEAAESLVYTTGIYGVILDPWNEISHPSFKEISETNYIAEALGMIRRFARSHQLHVWVVAHPTKLRLQEKGPYKGTYAPPIPFDISGSANWHNKADVCLSVYRDRRREMLPNAPPHIDVHIQKVRFRAVGKTGKVSFNYCNGRFEELRQQDAVPANDEEDEVL